MFALTSCLGQVFALTSTREMQKKKKPNLRRKKVKRGEKKTVTEKTNFKKQTQSKNSLKLTKHAAFQGRE